MKYAKYWGAIADHSGDAYFDFAYWHDWPNTLNELMKYRVPKRRAGVYDALREARRKGLDKGLDDGRIKLFRRINRTCMVATYDPDPGAPNGFRIPFIAESGEVLR
jgi:hypothetical protein